MTKKRAEVLIPQIIEASTEEQAAEVLRTTLKVLNLSADYIDLNNIKYELDDFEKRFEKIVDTYKKLESPKNYEAVHDIRLELNFLYREITDAVVFNINKNKIYFEEQKTVQRAESMLQLRDDEKFQGKIKATSASALRDIYGAAEGTKEFVNLASISYGLYKNLESLLNSIRMTTDSISSEEKYLLSVAIKDVK